MGMEPFSQLQNGKDVHPSSCFVGESKAVTGGRPHSLIHRSTLSPVPALGPCLWELTIWLCALGPFVLGRQPSPLSAEGKTEAQTKLIASLGPAGGQRPGRQASGRQVQCSSYNTPQGFFQCVVEPGGRVRAFGAGSLRHRHRGGGGEPQEGCFLWTRQSGV